MEISLPRMSRIARPFGSSFARSTVAMEPSRVLRWKSISPSTTRPGGCTIWRMERAVMLLPQPLSPTIHRVLPRFTSKVAPSRALTVPSSRSNHVLRLRTSSSRSSCWSGAAVVVFWVAAIDRSPSGGIGIGGVAEPVTEEIERNHGEHDPRTRQKQPRRGRNRADVLRLLQQHAPAVDRRAEPESEKAERGLGQDHGGDGQRDGGDDMAGERGHHVAQDDAHLAGAVEPGSGDELLLAQRQEAAAHHAGETRPAEHGQDDR